MSFKSWLAEASPGERYMGFADDGLKEAIAADRVFVARRKDGPMLIEVLSDRGRAYLKSIRWETKPIPVALRKSRPEQ